MRIIFAIPFILLISLLSSPSWSETVNVDDLVKRDDLYFKKFTDVPFTGETKITEETNVFLAIVYGDGFFKDGKKEGFWRKYFKDGSLSSRKTYANGIETGPSERYYENGQLWRKGNLKSGKRDGIWKFYNKNGRLSIEGIYQAGIKNGIWKFFSHNNGQLSARVSRKDGKYDGLVEYFNKDGSLSRTLTYKDGELVE